MKLLVIGSGGREHALVWKLAQSPHVTQLWCAPGNAGIGLERLAKNGAPVECVNLGAEELPRLLAFAQEKRVSLTVVGPDNPLALGIVDLFQKNGLRIWGPNQKAAQFESSKVFSQHFMEKYGIPTAKAGTFSAAAAAKRFAASLGGQCAVKADGLALGKGVLICTSVTEANKAIDEILVSKAFGAAGAKIVIQEFLEGMEISLHAHLRWQDREIVSDVAGSQTGTRRRPGFEHRRHGHVFADAVLKRRRIKTGWRSDFESVAARLRGGRD